MSLLQACGLSHRFQTPDPLFAGVNFEINPGDRVALVGPNGCGKSTLLRILAGTLVPDGGSIVRRRGLRIACFEQDATSSSAAPREEVERVLRGLGFDTRDLDLAPDRLSAGQRSRLYLATCLVSGAGLLLLDEPTNHLDERARQWLRHFLVRGGQTCMFVSHDVPFLAAAATRIFELLRGEFRTYSGGYELYRKEREARIAGQWSEFDQQEKRDAAMERAARRREELAARVAKAPDGLRDGHDFYRRKAAKIARTARILRERDLHVDRVAKPWEDRPIPRLDFVNCPRSGDVAVEVRDLSKSFGDVPVLDGVTFLCRRGERLGVRGPNGSGKTTLLRLLAGLEPPCRGTIRLGHNVKPGYYAQEGENLDLDATPEQVCLEESGDRTWIRTLLGCLRLPRELAGRPLRTLSFGERAKVALARLLVSDVNLLLLDEPTNHLETEARRALAATLAQYPGTIVFVSHDDTFVDALGGDQLSLG